MPIPTKAEFQQATNLKAVISDKRATDTILNHIDALLDTFHAEASEPARAIILAKIYYATEAWLKKVERKEAGVNGRRKSDVYAFYVKVVGELSLLTEVPVNLLPNWLAGTFGKAMVAHGAELDIRDNLADYLSEIDVRKFRLSFRGGLAYQQQWWTNRTDQVIASSANVIAGTAPLAARQGNAGVAVISAHFSGYVLSQGGDFYTGPHFAPRPGPQGGNTGRYHSSYFGGEAILSAGEIRIDDGQVVEINTNSGHYQPTPTHLRMAVETLAMNGVALGALWVHGFGLARMRAPDYLQLAGQNFAPMRAGAPAGWAAAATGDTPASRARIAATRSAHRSSLARRDAFALFALHCKPRGNGGVHGPAGRERCPECQRVSQFWPDYIEYMARR